MEGADDSRTPSWRLMVQGLSPAGGTIELDEFELEPHRKPYCARLNPLHHHNPRNVQTSQLTTSLPPNSNIVQHPKSGEIPYSCAQLPLNWLDTYPCQAALSHILHPTMVAPNALET